MTIELPSTIFDLRDDPVNTGERLAYLLRSGEATLTATDLTRLNDRGRTPDSEQILGWLTGLTAKMPDAKALVDDLTRDPLIPFPQHVLDAVYQNRTSSAVEQEASLLSAANVGGRAWVARRESDWAATYWRQNSGYHQTPAQTLVVHLGDDHEQALHIAELQSRSGSEHPDAVHAFVFGVDPAARDRGVIDVLERGMARVTRPGYVYLRPSSPTALDDLLQRHRLPRGVELETVDPATRRQMNKMNMSLRLAPPLSIPSVIDRITAAVRAQKPFVELVSQVRNDLDVIAEHWKADDSPDQRLAEALSDQGVHDLPIDDQARLICAVVLGPDIDEERWPRAERYQLLVGDRNDVTRTDRQRHRLRTQITLRALEHQASAANDEQAVVEINQLAATLSQNEGLELVAARYSTQGESFGALCALRGYPTTQGGLLLVRAEAVPALTSGVELDTEQRKSITGTLVGTGSGLAGLVGDFISRRPAPSVLETTEPEVWLSAFPNARHQPLVAVRANAPAASTVGSQQV